MARGRHTGVKRQTHENLPKLEPGDKVPKTGLYRLNDGVRIRPAKKSKNRTTKLKKVRGFGRGR